MNQNGYNRRPQQRGNPYQNRQRRGRRRRRRFPVGQLVLCLLTVAVIFAVIFAVAMKDDDSSALTDSTTDVTQSVSTTTGTEGSTAEDTTSEPAVDPNAYTEMTLLSTGDVMYHNPQLDAAYDYATGTYDFVPCYKYIKNIVSAADYAVVNFESTLAGPDYAFQGWPTFNTPDSGLDALVDAGFDMMLFANNHCYDTQHAGVIRTQQTFEACGVDYIGARLDTTGKTYKTVEVNGITLGMLNSTDDLSYGNTAQRTVNGILLKGDDISLLDLFNHSLLDSFYAQTEARIAELRSAGADIIIYYIHWGDEYNLYHNSIQGEIAQKLCDLGVDVIIGGHPHVIQDAEILTSTADPSHSTLCFYSLGNLISNQNRLTLGDTMNSSHTENGLMVELTIRKYASGETMVTAVKTIPLWVHRYYDSAAARMRYEIVPIEAAIADPASCGLYNSNFGVTHATAALDMTNTTLDGICDVFASSVILPTDSTEN